MENLQEFLDREFLDNTYYNILLASVILLIGYALRKNISRFFSHFLYRFFRKFSQDTLHDEFVSLLLRPFQLLILLLSVYFALVQLHYPESWMHEDRRFKLMVYLDRGT